jgi:hypothetical protein
MKVILAGALSIGCLVQLATGGACNATPAPHTGLPPSVYYVRAQSLPHDRGFTVTGSVPQLRHAGASEAALNERLRSVVEQGITEAEASVRPTSGRFAGGGEFGIIPDRSLISANSVLVSALLPVTASRPYGTGSPYWLSVTITVSSPRSTVSISHVITAAGFGLLAKSLRARLEGNRCVEQLASKELSRATAPMASSFRQFAMLPSGLAVGFPASANGPLYECGSPYVVIPYSQIAGAMSPAGKALAEAVSER